MPSPHMVEINFTQYSNEVAYKLNAERADATEAQVLHSTMYTRQNFFEKSETAKLRRQEKNFK